jgi:hypothetical protein
MIGPDAFIYTVWIGVWPIWVWEWPLVIGC